MSKKTPVWQKISSIEDCLTMHTIEIALILLLIAIDIVLRIML